MDTVTPRTPRGVDRPRRPSPTVPTLARPTPPRLGVPGGRVEYPTEEDPVLKQETRGGRGDVMEGTVTRDTHGDPEPEGSALGVEV